MKRALGGNGVGEDLLLLTGNAPLFSAQPEGSVILWVLTVSGGGWERERLVPAASWSILMEGKERTFRQEGVHIKM